MSISIKIVNNLLDMKFNVISKTKCQFKIQQKPSIILMIGNFVFFYRLIVECIDHYNGNITIFHALLARR